MRKILACTLFLSILLGCATPPAHPRNARGPNKKPNTETPA